MLNNPGRYAEKRKEKTGGIPVCPIMTIGQPSAVLCVQDTCAFYVKNFKMCSIYMMGHNAALDIKMKQMQQVKK